MEEEQIFPFVEKKHRISYYPNEEPMVEVFKLDPDSVALLNTFLIYIDEWHGLGISPSALSSSFSFQYKRGKETKFGSSPPDPLQLSALYNAQRPFILQKESTYYFKIVKALVSSCESQRFRKLMKGFNRRYRGKDTQPRIDFKAGGELISYETIFQHWLNGYVFHRDENSRELINSFECLFPHSALVAYFGMLFVDRARVIGQVAILVRSILADDLERLTNVE